MSSRCPLVSVLIPAYNHEAYVQEAIRSIMAQTWRHIELIVVDDGSRDATYERMEALRAECEARFVRTLFRTRPNVGTCETLNELMSLAQGEYVYLIASDDAAAPQAIERELEFLEQHADYVLAVGDCAWMNAESQRIGWDAAFKECPLEQAVYQSFGRYLQWSRKDVDFASEDFGSYESLVPRNYIPNGYLVRASALRAVGGFTKEAPLEDYYLMLQLAKLGKMRYVDEILFFYRWHAANTAQQRERMGEMTCQTLRYERTLVQRKGYEKWHEIFEQNIDLIYQSFRLGKVLHFYKKVYSLDGTKQKVLELFGHRFILKTKRPKGGSRP